MWVLPVPGLPMISEFFLDDELEGVQFEACCPRQLGVEAPVEVGQRHTLVEPAGLPQVAELQ